MKYCYCKIGYRKLKPNFIYEYIKTGDFHQVIGDRNDAGTAIFHYDFHDVGMFNYLFKPIISFESEMRDQKIEDIISDEKV